MTHRAQDLIQLFNPLFIPRNNTELVCCEKEPIYRPADHNHPHHRIIFAHGFFASALHEIAHWSVAGKERRLQEDFGYWYVPDGRTPAQQKAFENVEIKPQALEWIFSQSAGFRFEFSADNLSGGTGISDTFKNKVWDQVTTYLSQGMPVEANIWSQALSQHYRHGQALKLNDF